MEQFQQIGEVLGSLKALMVFQNEIGINQRQCCLLADTIGMAFNVVAEEMKQNLEFGERVTQWKALEHPFKELHKVLREAELYIKQSMEARDWWAKAISLNQNTDCVDLHLHNLLWCVSIVVEAIENVAEISGTNKAEMFKKRFLFSNKYEREWLEPSIFQHKFGKQYLVSLEICQRMDSAQREDHWVLSEMIADKKNIGLTKQETRLSELLLCPRGKLFPSSMLMNSKDYQFRRRLGPGGEYKEIQWMGESFVIKHLFGEVEPIAQQVSLLPTPAHSNVMHILYAFADEEKKECFLVMELMHKDLSSCIKEVSSPRRRVPFPLLVTVDIMLQIARGMEYLHSQKIYHGDLNPSNILVRIKNSSQDGYLHVKVTGFGVLGATNKKAAPSGNATTDACIWQAPEVLSEQEQSAETRSALKSMEKADVYSFGMICFELLTGKVPFEDSHLQGDKMSRNIRSGERPLFPHPSPKYLTNLVKKCWQTEPSLRPSFPSICRVLRYIKRFLVLDPDHNQPDSLSPPVDYFDLEMNLSNMHANWGRKERLQVSEIPYQMFAYGVLQREKTFVNLKERSYESCSEEISICGEENAPSVTVSDDALSTSVNSSKSSEVSSNTSKSSQVGSDTSRKSLAKKAREKGINEAGQRRQIKSTRPLMVVDYMRTNSGRRLQKTVASPGSRRSSAHTSDNELP